MLKLHVQSSVATNHVIYMEMQYTTIHAFSQHYLTEIIGNLTEIAICE